MIGEVFQTENQSLEYYTCTCTWQQTQDGKRWSLSLLLENHDEEKEILHILIV